MEVRLIEVINKNNDKNLEKRIKVEDGYEIKGSFKIKYVSSKTCTIPAILL